jgi:hypothetical protein
LVGKQLSNRQQQLLDLLQDPGRPFGSNLFFLFYIFFIFFVSGLDPVDAYS